MTSLREKIDRLVAKNLVADGPGVAILVMSDGEILHIKGYGFSNVAKKHPITVDTVFDLASVSKQMTAIAILMLMEEEEIDLEDFVTDYLPEFEDPDPDNPILISDLLYHISGLADYSSDDWQGTNEEFSRLTLETHLQWLNQQDIHYSRGYIFEYNNSGYALLALIIQRVSEQAFSEFMQDYIFDPLDMKNTLVFDRLGKTIPNQAKGYAVSKNGQIKLSSFPSVMVGDGNVFSSIEDLAKYDLALRNEELITAESLALAFVPGALDNGTTNSLYGFGWEIADEYVEHGGSWDGTSTNYRHYIDTPVTIVVLSNNENYDTAGLTEKIAELLELN